MDAQHFAGNVAQQENQAAVGLEQVAVVSADEAGGSIVIAGVETRTEKCCCGKSAC